MQWIKSIPFFFGKEVSATFKTKVKTKQPSKNSTIYSLFNRTIPIRNGLSMEGRDEGRKERKKELHEMFNVLN